MNKLLERLNIGEILVADGATGSNLQKMGLKPGKPPEDLIIDDPDIEDTLEANIPVVGFSADLVRSGAVVGAYSRYKDIGKQAARLFHQLARQTSPSLLGTIISPGRVRQSINLRSARHLGLSLPLDVLRQFDEHF